MKIFFSLIKSFINDFRARKGGYIFISDILIKINSLILSFLIVRIISSEEYGNISYARAVIFPLTVPCEEAKLIAKIVAKIVM